MILTPVLVTITDAKNLKNPCLCHHHWSARVVMIQRLVTVFKRYSLVVSCGALISSCAPKHGEMVVATIGDDPISLPDYENLYIKSNGSREAAAATSQEDREKFLALMTKFRLKLADAYSRGLHKSAEVQREINQYKGSLATSFLTEREVTAPGIQRLYERRKDELRGYHILLNITPGMSPEETLAVYDKANSIISQLQAGADFATLAREHSQDPTVSQNGGDLYYFTAGQMLPQFEDSAYAMKPGQISRTPVRTQFGLHIVKITERRPSSGEIRASHIMIRFNNQDPSPEDTLAAYEKISLIQDSLKMGLDFADLAVRNSQDPGSASRGGDLDWFSRRRWILPFDDEAFKLKPGEVSGIVRTMYGYHLIKCYDARPMKSFEEAKEEIRRLYQQLRFQEDYARFVNRLKRDVQYQLHEDVLQRFMANIDSSKTGKDSAWASPLPDGLRAEPMFTFGQREISVDSVVGMLLSKPDLSNTPMRANVLRQQMDKIGEELVFSVKGDALERESPGFAAIMKEYTDGILLYQIEQERVWNSIAVTDSALRWYYERNGERFTYPDRLDISELRVANDSLASMVHGWLTAGKTFEQIADEDSARMKQPTKFRALFSSGSSAINKQSARELELAASTMRTEPGVRIHITAPYDTVSRKSQNQRLAERRLNAVKSYLTGKLGIDSARIVALTRIVQPAPAELTDEPAPGTRVDLEVAGLRPLLLAGIHAGLHPVATDERTLAADSLQVGQFSQPFRYKSWVSIVRLNQRQAARQKTFDEAGTELASAFQEYESKRLEEEWINELKRRYPVVEYKEVLKHAFTSAQ